MRRCRRTAPDRASVGAACKPPVYKEWGIEWAATPPRAVRAREHVASRAAPARSTPLLRPGTRVPAAAIGSQDGRGLHEGDAVALELLAVRLFRCGIAEHAAGVLDQRGAEAFVDAVPGGERVAERARHADDPDLHALEAALGSLGAQTVAQAGLIQVTVVPEAAVAVALLVHALLLRVDDTRAVERRVELAAGRALTAVRIPQHLRDAVEIDHVVGLLTLVLPVERV